MKHIGAILIKFIMTAVILEIVLQLVTALNWVEILTISVAVTVIAYLIGDLLILAISNNIVATIADAALAFVILYFYNYRFGYGAHYLRRRDRCRRGPGGGRMVFPQIYGQVRFTQPAA